MRWGWLGRASRKVRLWVRQGLSRALSRLYDGPRAPDRLYGFVYEYVRFYPHATRLEWMTFALRLGDEMYRSGYQRGFEAGVAEAKLMPRDDERFDWTWDVGVPRLSKPFLAETVPEADDLAERGYTDEERATRHLWKQQRDGDRMVQIVGAEDTEIR